MFTGANRKLWPLAFQLAFLSLASTWACTALAAASADGTIRQFRVGDPSITLVAESVCGDSLLDAGEQCDDGNVVGGDGCSATCQVEPGWSCTPPEPPIVGSESLPEGGFESGTPNPVWAEFSTNFDTPLCDAACGITPISGDWFVWFGGTEQYEEGSVQQAHAIDASAYEMTFARQLAICDSVNDFVRLQLDGNTVWEKNGGDPACGEDNPVTETIDLATAPGGPYNDGSSHTIRFESTTYAANGSHSSFYLDDVSILVGGSPPVPSECTYVGGDEYTIGGTVSGLAGSGLLLRNNGGDDLPIQANGSFTFVTPLVDGSSYAVSIASQPTSLNQTCSLENFSGTLAGANVTDVTVTCTTNSYSVGGTVTGLAGSGLVLQNNLADDLAIFSNGVFTFNTPLADGSNYSAKVLTQPSAPDQTCTISNAVGTLAGAAVSNISVSCVDNGICGDSLLGGGEQCDDGNTAGGDGCSATCQVEPGWSCTPPVPPVEASDILPEGDFEGGTPSPAWAESSTNFGTPICDAGCGVTPLSGQWFAWFGGTDQPEEAAVQQDVAIGATASVLTFKRQLADCDSTNDYVRLMLDGNTVWEKNGGDPACGEASPVTESVDLATASGGPYNDGQPHTIRFEATNAGASNFYIDDASIPTPGSPAVPSECTEGGHIFRDGFE